MAAGFHDPEGLFYLTRLSAHVGDVEGAIALFDRVGRGRILLFSELCPRCVAHRGRKGVVLMNASWRSEGFVGHHGDGDHDGHHGDRRQHANLPGHPERHPGKT